MNRPFALVFIALALAACGEAAQEQPVHRQRALARAEDNFSKDRDDLAAPAPRRPGPVAEKAPSPIQPAPPERPLPQTTASPYFFVMPQLGSWQLTSDSSFTVVMGLDGTVQYGPMMKGTYRAVDRQTIELNVQSADGSIKPGPILFHIEFDTGATMMAWSQGTATLVFRRVLTTTRGNP